jgi:hypothetical protein
MIHILTVHWEFDDWVDIQLKYLDLHIKEPYRVYAYLNRLQKDHSDKFFYSSDEDIKSHPVKLNLLADHVVRISDDPDDILIFIDGDAFPVGDVVSYCCEKLAKHKLIAVQRKENFGDIQPHPSFCMTTVGFWKQIAGDWQKGFTWENSSGEQVTDVGGNLLKLLQDAEVDWSPMVRSNRHNLHPLFFGIYDDLIYHHGAGFRKPYSRMDGAGGKIFNKEKLNFIEAFIYKRKYKKYKQEVVARNTQLVEEVFQALKADELFYKRFI